MIDELRGRGFSVVTFDWRGQGGSDRLLPNPRKAHIADFAAYDQDLDGVIKLLVRPTAADLKVPVIAMAHSMGGNILLRRLHDVQQEFASAIFARPWWASSHAACPGGWWKGSPTWSQPQRRFDGFRLGRGRARSTECAFLASDRHFGLQTLCPHPGDVWSRDPELQAQWADLGLAGGGAPLHGSAADSRAMPKRSPHRRCFLAQATTSVCESETVRVFAARMSGARYVEVPDAQHEILMERDVFRVQLWSAFDSFIKESAPAFSR